MAKNCPNGEKDSSNGCPMGNNGTTKSDNGLTYNEYLCVDTLLSAHVPQTEEHDEHIFITVHQVYELWFKQILMEVDYVRAIFMQPTVAERNMLKVNAKLTRIVQILKILVDQIMILETMTPMDFADFRTALGTSSGFQSWQFRLLENKFGIKKENRIRYGQVQYSDVFTEAKYKEPLLQSETEASLFDCVQAWLERTPGLEENGFNFWSKYVTRCRQWLKNQEENIEKIEDDREKEIKREAHTKNMANFNQLLDPDVYESLVKKGDRRFSWQALKGALMISFYCEELVFHQPFRMLQLLMDIDSLLTKWRYNHVMLVQRQLGSKIGSGGSSGYQYLRSTVSDRYKVFLDLFNLSNYIIPREYIPVMSSRNRTRLSSVCMPDMKSFEESESSLAELSDNAVQDE